MAEALYCKDCAYYRTHSILHKRFFFFKKKLQQPVCEHTVFKSLVSGISGVSCYDARNSHSSACGQDAKLWEAPMPSNPKERTFFILKKK